ncbi:hypothetical protein H2198_003495 [Neophaeococcomyces mojaviensis]|uniref:Uncharacterized protein n=1 Tax=Neophaeococcomyces mojaviensis TaxID=3383035 RepID=A0ACC3AB93_9EURO|nr:hypothetical protein H2198_003495 [Knufia sp. JES_112]
MTLNAADDAASKPSPFNYILSFLLVSLAWGFTTPFIRRAALSYTAPIEDTSKPFVARKLRLLFLTVVALLRKPSYAVPLVLNLTGSIWFFLLVGQAELSLTVPITNSLAFLFTVLGEWGAEGKIITKDTWIGMTLVCAGIALCVISKT